MLLRELVGLSLHGSIARGGGGEDEPGQVRLKTPGRFNFGFQFGLSDLGPQAPVLLLALDADELAFVMTEDVHAVLLLAAASVLLRARVLPDVLPQVEAEGFEGGGVIRRIPAFNIGTHEDERFWSLYRSTLGSTSIPDPRLIL